MKLLLLVAVVALVLQMGNSTSLLQFRQQALRAHNVYRRRHGSPDLKLNQKLNNVAQRYAQRLAASDNCLVHSGGKYGENLYYSTGQVKGNAPVKMWYNENELYNYNAPGFSMGTGHFTQVVWKGSRLLGIGRAKTSSGKTCVVANYSPAGNMQGQFEQNVLSADEIDYMLDYMLYKLVSWPITH